jgi:hypothetical protein
MPMQRATQDMKEAAGVATVAGPPETSKLL